MQPKIKGAPSNERFQPCLAGSLLTSKNRIAALRLVNKTLQILMFVSNFFKHALLFNFQKYKVKKAHQNKEFFSV